MTVVAGSHPSANATLEQRAEAEALEALRPLLVLAQQAPAFIAVATVIRASSSPPASDAV